LRVLDGLTVGWGGANVVVKHVEEMAMVESIVEILAAMQASHEGFLARLLDWKAGGGRLPAYRGAETFEDLVNRERLAVSRCKMAIEHIREHETRVV